MIVKLFYYFKKNLLFEIYIYFSNVILIANYLAEIILLERLILFKIEKRDVL